ncbi:ABC transporter substrate-binding protein [Thaumasiovibrio subtropicus]|uniref:ABC transporter substrate-binding protein n=1 Tax=Thaumasiovibrio subtropicus TaxID=1891207 RepID=UPI000B34F2B1|nr:ABC transporter substrate-binding protein [Thaumasiovibrio subtropicus]
MKFLLPSIWLLLLFPGSALSSAFEFDTVEFREDTSLKSVTNTRIAGSHVKIHMPNLPYIASAHAINGSLVRPADNERGWEYYMATSHKQITPTLYEFSLRQGVRFQDGTPFNADSVVLNIEHYQKQPYTFSRMHIVLDRAEKIDDYTVRFHLKEEYGLMMYDAIWLLFYSPAYLEKFGWNGKPFCPNLAEAGPYGLGPYILKEGYIEGDRRTPTAELVRNPYYWDPNSPKVDRITIIMDISSAEATELTLNTEGNIDITPIAFGDVMGTIFSPYGKLMRRASNNNYLARFNLFTGHPIFREVEVRAAINRAIDQQLLAALSMNGEGKPTYVSLSERFYGVKESMARLPAPRKESSLNKQVQAEIIAVIDKYKPKYGFEEEEQVPLIILAQESPLFLLKDIKYFLEQVNIDVTLEVVSDESEMFANNLAAIRGENARAFDIVLWPNFDWIRHPWSSFFIFHSETGWSTFEPGSDDVMDQHIKRFFATSSSDPHYIQVLADLSYHIYQQNYVLHLPTPHATFALNKEVVFTPSVSAIYPLWDIQVSDLHWSVRQGEYPSEHLVPIAIQDPREVDHGPKLESAALSPPLP